MGASFYSDSLLIPVYFHAVFQEVLQRLTSQLIRLLLNRNKLSFGFGASLMTRQGVSALLFFSFSRISSLSVTNHAFPRNLYPGCDQ